MILWQGNTRNRKIVNVEAEPVCPGEIDITLDNGSFITLTLKQMEGNPLFVEIPGLAMPRTDGGRVYWSNGASLTLDEIMAALLAEDINANPKPLPD